MTTGRSCSWSSAATARCNCGRSHLRDCACRSSSIYALTLTNSRTSPPIRTMTGSSTTTTSCTGPTASRTLGGDVQGISAGAKAEQLHHRRCAENDARDRCRSALSAAPWLWAPGPKLAAHSVPSAFPCRLNLGRDERRHIATPPPLLWKGSGLLFRGPFRFSAWQSRFACYWSVPLPRHDFQRMSARGPSQTWRDARLKSRMSHARACARRNLKGCCASALVGFLVFGLNQRGLLLHKACPGENGPAAQHRGPS